MDRVFALSSLVTSKHGFLESANVNFLWNRDANVASPCIRVDGVRDWEGHVGFVVCGVLPEDSASAGGVEILACHCGRLMQDQK